MVCLEHEPEGPIAEARQVRLGLRVDAGAFEFHAALLRSLQTCERIKKRALSRATRAAEEDRFTLRNRDRDAAQHFNATVADLKGAMEVFAGEMDGHHFAALAEISRVTVAPPQPLS